jgi:predicted RNA-binding protein YlxR (DUF448 family)
MKPRHIPIRTCTGCREEHPKRELIRVVRTPSGSVVVDPSGKQPGRGAYVCRRPDCWSTALRGSLAHVLKTTLTAGDRAALERFAAEELLSETPAAMVPAEG